MITAPVLLAALCLSPASAQTSRALPSGGSETAYSDRVERTDTLGRRAGTTLRSQASAPGPNAAGQRTSGSATWRPLGPFGGDISDVASSPTTPSVVLAGAAPPTADGALYRSTDGGDTWTEIAAFSGLDVYDLEFDAAGTAYAGTLDGVWQSSDDGASWTALPLGIGPNDGARDVTVDPTNSQRLWVGVDDAVGNQTQNLLLSVDGGATWTDQTPVGAQGTGCTGVAIDPAAPNVVLATFGGAFGGGSVWVSTDGGSTWTDRSAGIPPNPLNDCAAVNGTLLVVGGQLFGGQFVGVFESTDLGVTWTALHDASWPSLAINDIDIDPSNPSRIAVASAGSGVFGSADGGVTWSFGIGGTGALSVNEVSFSPQTNTRIFVGSSSNAVWRSDDAGANFGPSSVGIQSLNVVSVAENPNDANVLAIAFQGLNDGGVYTSTDGGATWGLEALPGTRYNTVEFDPSGTLYAISDGPTTNGTPEGLYRRAAGSWTSIGPDQGSAFESELVALRFSENDPGLILTGGSDFGVADFEATVWRSTDAGATWTKAYEGVESFEDVLDIEIVEDGTDQTALACFTDISSNLDGGVLRTVDGGASWAPSNAGLPSDVSASSLAPSPSSVNRFFLASQRTGGVLETNDAGLTWTDPGYGVRTWYVEAARGSANVLYAAGFDAPRLRISKDGGQTFSAFDTGAGAAGQIRGLRLSRDGRTLYASASSGAWATDASDAVGVPFCSPGVPNSTGGAAFIEASGSNSAAENDVTLTVTGMPPSQFALFLGGPFQGITQNPGGSQGTLCLTTSIGRFNGQIQNSGAAGVVSISVDLTAVPTPNSFVSVMPGESWTFQCWYRDTNPGVTSNLSDAVEITFE